MAQPGSAHTWAECGDVGALAPLRLRFALGPDGPGAAGRSTPPAGSCLAAHGLEAETTLGPERLSPLGLSRWSWDLGLFRGALFSYSWNCWAGIRVRVSLTGPGLLAAALPAP